MGNKAKDEGTTGEGQGVGSSPRESHKTHVKREMSKHAHAHDRFKVYANKMLDQAVAMVEAGATVEEVRAAVKNHRAELDEVWADIERVAQ